MINEKLRNNLKPVQMDERQTIFNLAQAEVIVIQKENK